MKKKGAVVWGNARVLVLQTQHPSMTAVDPDSTADPHSNVDPHSTHTHERTRVSLVSTGSVAAATRAGVSSTSGGCRLNEASNDPCPASQVTLVLLREVSRGMDLALRRADRWGGWPCVQ